MNQGAKIVSDAIIGNDFKVVVVNLKSYIIYPPTIHKIAGAASYLSNVGKIENLEDIFLSMKDTPMMNCLKSCQREHLKKMWKLYPLLSH